MFNNIHSNERGSPSISTLNLSSNNFSKELANLASLNNSSDNVIENASSSVATTVSTTTTKPSSICDNHLSNNVNDVVIDLSKTSTTTTYTNGTVTTECTIPSKTFLMLQQQDNQNNSTDSSQDQSYVNCNVNVKNESHQNHNHQPLPSTSSGHGAPNLFDLLANLENEIAITQQHLDDENDKRHKYKVTNSEYFNSNSIIILIRLFSNCRSMTVAVLIITMNLSVNF